MVVIHYNTAFKALDSYVKSYNERTDELSDQVRQSVAATARELIRIYGPALIKANGIGPVDKDNLPSLRTNNVQLAKLNNCSTRTIHRHINKLLQAGILTKKVWHGTNSSYELWINPKILLVTKHTSPSEVKIVEDRPADKNPKTLENSDFEPAQSTKRPHTDTGNIYNNIVIGVHNPKNESLDAGPRHIGDIAGTLAGCTKKRRELSLTTLNDAGNTIAGNTREKVAKKKEKFRAGFAENMKEAREKVRAGDEKQVPQPPENKARSASLSFYVQMLWVLAKNVLYKDVFLTERQETIALKLIRKWYEPVADSALSRVHEIYVERIGLVQKYVQKDPKNRYVQLPYRYFDPNNQSGFTGSKPWWKAEEKRKKELQEKLIVSAQIRRFLNNQKKSTEKRKPSLQLYRDCEQRIGKLGKPLLLEQFYAAVLTPDSKNYLHPN